jgi:hypothetical protein
MFAAAQLTATLLPEVLTVGAMPGGIVAAALPPAPLPWPDHAASGAAGASKASPSIAQAIAAPRGTVTSAARARCR